MGRPYCLTIAVTTCPGKSGHKLTPGPSAKIISRKTVGRLAIAGALPHAVVCHGARKTTRRYPRRFAKEFAASGLDTADLAAFAAA